MKTYVFLFDLDGTIVDIAHRLKHLRKPAPDWKAFYAAADSDELIPAGAVMYNLLVTQCRVLGHAIKQGGISAEIPFIDVMTWRPESQRAQTISFLSTCGLLMPRKILMRRDDDNRYGEQIKLEMWERNYEGREDVLAVVEDNDTVAQTFNAIGISCLRLLPA